MTINSEYRRAEFDIAVAQTIFPFNFEVIEGTDLIVTVKPSIVDDEVVVDPADYVPALSGSELIHPGGQITFAAAPTGYRLYVYRQTPRTQEIEYQRYDTFPAESHEFALDKLTLIAQEIDQDILGLGPP